MWQAPRPSRWNIAEGCGRGTDADFARFLQHSLGSTSESHDRLIQALDLRYLDADHFAALEQDALSIGRRLGGLIRRLRRDSAR